MSLQIVSSQSTQNKALRTERLGTEAKTNTLGTWQPFPPSHADAGTLASRGPRRRCLSRSASEAAPGPEGQRLLPAALLPVPTALS